MHEIVSTRLIVGLEVHVELGTRTKMFTRVGSPAAIGAESEPEPNTLIDPVVLGLPGALPVINREAVRLSALVGLALGCRVAEFTKWDRKSYYYPDLPKNYQISQYDLPLCFDGAVDMPDPADPEGDSVRRIGIIRAHLEEDAGKLLHEWPGGRAIDFSIADYNRAGTPLLEIVTAPDFRTADEVVAFARMLRDTCRFLGVTEGIMQKGHMRFEPNINMELTLGDGRVVRTPIVEVKNLNSFRSLKGAVEYEASRQPGRWEQDGREMGRGAKSTRGWDDHAGETFLQREKEDAHDYRYFPDPDLPPVRLTTEWIESLRRGLPELPAAKQKRYRESYALRPKEARALVEEPGVCRYFEAIVESVCRAGVPDPSAGKSAANLVLQSAARRANERGVLAHELGVPSETCAEIIALRESGEISAAGSDELFGLYCDGAAPGGIPARQYAEQRGLIQVRDAGALRSWCREVMENPGNDRAVSDVRAGKDAAIGRLVGEVMKLSGGKADAKSARELLLRLIRG